MSTLLHLIALGVLLFVMGYLTAQPGRRSWRKMAGFIGATALAVGMTVLGMILVIVILGLYIGSIALLNLELGSSSASSPWLWPQASSSSSSCGRSSRAPASRWNC